MRNIKNSVLVKQVFNALYTVIGRRTLDSFAVQILKTTINKLEKKYEFLSLVTIEDDFLSEGGIQATFEQSFEDVEPSHLGEALDTLIRVIYGELTETIGDDAGLYFITELKQHLGESSVDDLRAYGVHFEHIQSEQHLRIQQKGPRIPPPVSQKKDQGETPYTWEMVSTWKYHDNICLLYDEKGRLLDTLQLDLIIEEYVERVIESQKDHRIFSPKTTMLQVTPQEMELLEMIRRRDSDVDSVVTLLHVSRQKFDTMIQKLLQLEMLQYLSDNEVKITEKGLQYLSERQKKE
jgi:hypothetical protein